MTGYLRFCQFYQLTPFPATEWQLVQFARYIANGVTCFNTVKAYLSVIKRAHEIGKFYFPKEVQLLQLELKGIRFELAGPVKKAIPITPSILMEIYKHVKLSLPVHVACYTALVVRFCLFLRRSNLVPETQIGFNKDEQLTRKDVFKFGKILVVDIRWHKSHQYKDKDLFLPLIPAKSMQVCPIIWLNYLMSKNGGSRDDPLFAYRQGGKLIPLTTEVLSKQLKDWIELCGKNPDGFTLHGLRCRGANHALTSGIGGEDLKLMGDWCSNAYMTYLDLSLDRRITNMVQFVECLDDIVQNSGQWMQEEVVF